LHILIEFYKKKEVNISSYNRQVEPKVHELLEHRVFPELGLFQTALVGELELEPVGYAVDDADQVHDENDDEGGAALLALTLLGP
jgi:hypothetical protein